MDKARDMYRHFSIVASNYRQIRTTDHEPIEFIAESLNWLHDVKAADIGCGGGRYDLLLFKHLKNLHLTCIDINESMLKQVSDYLTDHKIINFKTIKADANVIPLEDNSMDCIVTFNAIHHFDLKAFIKNSCKALKKNGNIFIYTRLRSQNNRNIWGQHFPFFSEKETRLYEIDDVEQSIQSVKESKLETAKRFKYKRKASLRELIEKVEARHYSTFSLYKEDELNETVSCFQENICREFKDTEQIEWFDENILFVLKAA